MADEVRSLQQPPANYGWRVTFAGMGINLALGVLYAWSVISKNMPAEWKWSESGKSWPFAIACLVFCLVMVPAGRMQDRIGPRIVATIGGILVGIGMVLASFYNTSLGYIVGFGVLAGAGIGFGYAAATPPAVKWFPKAKTGLIAGLVVSGFGLASVYISPLAEGMIKAYGVPATVLAFGIGFLVIVVGLAQLLKAPPKDYVPAGSAPVPVAVFGQAVKKQDFTPTEMLKTWQFYLLWFMYACGAGAGLMVISKLAAMAKVQASIELGFVLVAVLAVGNGGGRILAGMLSDKIGRKVTLCICFVLQAGLIALLSQTQSGTFLANAVVLAVVSALIGANYGANLSLFPSVTKDYYGLKNFGVNYGLVFTAWGVGGFMLSMLAGAVYDGKVIASMKGSFSFAYYCSIVLLIVAAAVTFLVKAPHHVQAQMPEL